MDNKLVVKHNAGFFSCCTIRMIEIIRFYNKNKVFPIVDSSEQWAFYKDQVGDITHIFFSKCDEKNQLDDTIKEIDDGTSPNNLLDFKNLNFLVKKYFSPSDVVMGVYDKLIEKYSIDFDKTIAVLYRGNDKHKETNLPSHSDMIKKIDDLALKYPDHKLLIQSDEVDFYESVMKKHKNFIYFEEVMKIRKNEYSAIQYAVPSGQKTEQAIIFLAIMLIISKCSKVILNSGNIGMWTSLFRGNSSGIYQYLNHKEYVYGVYNPLHGTEKEYWIEN
jgi:hypothetical protein